jgi:hypothetical protein
MTQEALERCLDEKVEPSLDPDREMQIVCFVGNEKTGFLDVRRGSSPALIRLAHELLKLALEDK